MPMMELLEPKLLNNFSNKYVAEAAHEKRRMMNPEVTYR